MSNYPSMCLGAVLSG